MRRLAQFAWLLPLALSLVAPEPRAADPAPATPTTATATTPKPAPVYQPPARGKPRGRVGGGARGLGSTLPALTALVPDHTGETLKPQPSLFFALAPLPPEGGKLVFVLSSDESVEPLVEAELARPSAAGLQRIDLASYGVELRTGLEYEWSVAITLDPERRSRDVVTVGWIERTEPPAGLATNDPRALAVAGFWYDAFASAPAELRQTLLRDAGLDALAPTAAP
jgi:hypothetical protein